MGNRGDHVLGEAPPKVSSGSYPCDVVRISLLPWVECPGWMCCRWLLQVGVEVTRTRAKFCAVGQGSTMRIRDACAFALFYARCIGVVVCVERRLFAMRVTTGPTRTSALYCMKASGCCWLCAWGSGRCGRRRCWGTRTRYIAGVLTATQTVHLRQKARGGAIGARTTFQN